MEENQNNEMIEVNPQNNKNKKVILIAVIAVIFVLIIGIIALAATGIFKSKGEKFLELLTKEQYFVEMVEDRQEDFDGDGEISYNLALKKNFLSIIDSTFTLLGNDLILDANVIKQGENFDTIASLKLGTFELQNLEVIKENDLIALGAKNLFDNYIAINDENVIDVAQKLGFTTEEENTKIDEELLKILNKYGKILAKSINCYINIENNIEVDINENSIVTKQYLLSLGEKELNKIALDILEVLKDDDKTIKFIANYYNEDITKQNIESLYDEILTSYDEITSEEPILEVKLNVLNNKTLKTTISINSENGISEIILSSNTDNEKDYTLLILSINDTALYLEYEGEKMEETYEGEIKLRAEGAEITAANLIISKVHDSSRTVRKINELEVLLLNEASDSELESLRREIERNLGIVEDEDLEEMIYEEGEFKLDNPDARMLILEPSINKYNKINFGITEEDVKTIMGVPSAEFEVDERKNMGWYFDKNQSIYFISVEFLDGKVYKVYNDVASSMENNIQISTELGTEVEDLTLLVSKIDYGMTKSDVIEILGDKCLEIAKDNDGYRTYKWYDKNENILIIEFDSEEKISYIDTVTMDY